MTTSKRRGDPSETEGSQTPSRVLFCGTISKLITTKENDTNNFRLNNIHKLPPLGSVSEVSEPKWASIFKEQKHESVQSLLKKPESIVSV